MTEKKATKPETVAPVSETEEKALDLVVNLDGMTIGDLEVLEQPQSAREMVEMLDRLVVNVDIRPLPVSQLGAVKEAVLAEIRQLAKNPT